MTVIRKIILMIKTSAYTNFCDQDSIAISEEKNIDIKYFSSTADIFNKVFIKRQIDHWSHKI